MTVQYKQNLTKLSPLQLCREKGYGFYSLKLDHRNSIYSSLTYTLIARKWGSSMMSCLRLVPRVRSRRPSKPSSGPPIIRMGLLRADFGISVTGKKRVSSDSLLARMKSSICLSGTTIGAGGSRHIDNGTGNCAWAHWSGQ